MKPQRHMSDSTSTVSEKRNKLSIKPVNILIHQVIYETPMLNTRVMGAVLRKLGDLKFSENLYIISKCGGSQALFYFSTTLMLSPERKVPLLTLYLLNEY